MNNLLKYLKYIIKYFLISYKKMEGEKIKQGYFKVNKKDNII